jgi:hypothetical protein
MFDNDVKRVLESLGFQFLKHITHNEDFLSSSKHDKRKDDHKIDHSHKRDSLVDK